MPGMSSWAKGLYHYAWQTGAVEPLVQCGHSDAVGNGVEVVWASQGCFPWHKCGSMRGVYCRISASTRLRMVLRSKDALS